MNEGPVLQFGSATANIPAQDWEAVRRLVPTVFSWTDIEGDVKKAERWALDRTIRLVRDLRIEAMEATTPKRRKR